MVFFRLVLSRFSAALSKIEPKPIIISILPRIPLRSIRGYSYSSVVDGFNCSPPCWLVVDVSYFVSPHYPEQKIYPPICPLFMGVRNNSFPRKNQSVVLSALPAGGTSFFLYFSSTGGLAMTRFRGTAEFSLTTA